KSASFFPGQQINQRILSKNCITNFIDSARHCAILACYNSIPMANAEHLRLLNTATWNHWRKSNTTTTPDFVGADLSGMDLSGKDLHQAHLSNATIMGTTFHSADLRGVLMTGATVQGTRFHKTKMEGINLDYANLNNMDFA